MARLGRGTLRPGRVTLRDVAETAGVSRSAVSRTFTNGASVSKRMRQKVESAAKKLGYRPNLLARSLTTRRTALIGLISDNFENPVLAEVFHLFTQQLQDRGLRPLLLNLASGGNAGASVQTVIEYSVDGVILASSLVPRDFTAAFVEAGVPIVHAFGRYTPRTPVSVVSVDNVHGGELAAQRLVDGGYRAIGFLGGPSDASSTEDRLQGFTRILQQVDLTPFATGFAARYGYEEGYRGLRSLLSGAKVDAVFCGDDILAMGARDACRDLGIRVPEDLGLISFNDMATAAWRAYNLTTIRQPIREIIVAAVDQIIAHVETPDLTPEGRLFPCSLVERGTLRPIETDATELPNGASS